MVERLIVTNGDTAAEGLRAAGIAGDVLPWRDVLHDGPVPQESSLEALSKIRARYLADEFGDRDGIDRDFAARDAAIRQHDSYDRVELWFEHDLYDQLQLIQIVDVLSGLGRIDGVFLVQADDYLGPMSADVLRRLEPSARPVTARQFAAAKRAWTAFTAETPVSLAAIASDVSPLPYLPAAVRRLIAELPAMASGLGLTEERTLGALADRPGKVGHLFKITQGQEDARFLGDASFFRRLDGLMFCTAPLIAGLPFPSPRRAHGPGHPDYRAFVQSDVTLTESGRAALAGKLDHVRENGIDRWLGGTHLTPQNVWRRDRNGGIVPPTLQ
jgi:Domain of unknown function (DUF1835)